ADNKRFHLVPEPLLTWQRLPDLPFDAVIFTRFFPWELEDDQQRCRLSHFLRMLRTPMLFLEGTPSPDSRSGTTPAAPNKNASDESALDALLSFVSSETRLGQLTQIGFIGETPLYRFSS